MKKNKKLSSDSIVTLVPDPYSITTEESSHESLDDSSDELLDESSDDSSLLDRISGAMDEIQSDSEKDLLSTEKTDLAAQIAEDQALAREMLEEALEEIKAENSNDNNTPSFSTTSPLDQAEIQSCIEALLFISDKPLSADRLRTLLGPDYDLSLFQDALAELCQRYQSTHHGIELVEAGGGYQFRTKPGRSTLAQKLVKVQTQRLSSGCMETLAITAYRQPVMKEDIDKIRGVDSSYFIRGLMDRKLIQISGRSELPGRPILYSTTAEFLEVFGLKDLSSLPSLRELEQMIPASEANSTEDEPPEVKKMRRLVGEMKADESSILNYNPKEDEKILKEFRERVASIPTSTPYLDEMKAAEEALAQQELQQTLSEETADNTNSSPSLLES